MNATNNHFKSMILQWNNFKKNNTMPPEDLAFDFVNELRVSNLLMPIVLEEEGVSFPNIITPDNSRFLPVFTDMEEVSKYSKDMDVVNNDINYYIELISSMGIDGMAINCEGENVIIDRDLLDSIPLLIERNYDDGFDYAKLKDIAYQTSNEEIVEFIRDEDNFNRYDELMNLVKKSTLLNVVTCEKDMDEFTHDGVISIKDAGGFGFTSMTSAKGRYAVLFTDRDSIIKTADFDSEFYYMQLIDLYYFIKFVLSNDMDGIILNPDLEQYYIPRNALLKAFNEDLINPDFSKASLCAFKIR